MEIHEEEGESPLLTCLAPLKLRFHIDKEMV